MFKNLLIAGFALLFTVSAFAAGPSQIWRLEVTGTDEGVCEIAELQLMETSGGVNATDLIRNFTYEETAIAGSASWSVVHNLGIQRKYSDVDVIAYDVDVVAPGEYFVSPSTTILVVRTNLMYQEIEYIITDIAPTTPETGDVYHSVAAGEYYMYNGATWDTLTVTSTNTLPIPNVIEPTSITLEPSGALPSAGGPAANNIVTVAFAEPVVGAATVFGSSFDNVSVNRPGSALPPSELIPNRAGAVIFDNNKGSWFKSNRAPTERTPLAMQYTYWVGDPDRYPNIVEYSITAKNAATAPKSWILRYYKEGKWHIADQQAGFRFEDGQTRAFPINE